MRTTPQKSIVEDGADGKECQRSRGWQWRLRVGRRAVTFFVSEDASFTTGTEFFADSGAAQV